MIESLPDILFKIPGYDPEKTAGDCEYIPAKADHISDYFLSELVFIEGGKAGQPFRLEDWQESIIKNLYGWYRPDGTRRYRTAFIFVPRKNGKTPFCAGIVDYMLFCDDEPGSQVYSAAGEREQAALCYRHAAGMIERNPDMAKRCRTYRTYKSIEAYNGNAVYKALSADSETKHGLNAQCIIVDELHVQPNRDLVDTLVTSTASRRQPLLIYITTAGIYNKTSICWEIYDYACKVRDGLIDDPYFLPVIYEADKDDDWTDEDVWAKANPNLGVSVSLDYLRGECKKAQELPAYQNTFRRLHLNQWTEQDVRWIPMDKWESCAAKFDESDLLGRECFLGIDMSSTTDLSGLSLVFPWEKGFYRTLFYAFAPEDNAKKREDRDRVPYLQWAREGHLILTPGNIVDYDFVRKFIKRLAGKFQIREIAMDPWNSTQLQTQLTDDGFTVIKFRQGYVSMTAPCKELEKLILAGLIQHNNNPVANWCMSNVAVDMDPAGNLKPNKSKSTERIDIVVALLEGLGQAMVAPEKVTSVYEKRGLLIL